MAASTVQLPAGAAGASDGGESVDVQIFDTAGQERFAPLTTPFYRNTDGVMIIYDVGSRKAFERTTEYWKAEVDRHAPPGVPVLLMGTKADLAEEQPEYRQVTNEEGAGRAQENGLLFCETSARTGASVTDAFVLLTCEAMNWRNEAGVDMQSTGGGGRIVFGGEAEAGRKRKDGCSC